MTFYGPVWGKNISVLGAGPHGHQLRELLYQEGCSTIKLYDDQFTAWRDIIDGADEAEWVVGAAWPEVKFQIAHKASFRDKPAAWVYGSNNKFRGTIVFPGAQIGNDVILKSHVHVEFNAVISHGCVVGPFTTICPGAVLAGEVTVEEQVFVGANATILHGGITLGARSIIGAGAVVTKDVPPGATVAGVPARII